MSNTKLALSFRIFKNGQLLREDKLTQGVIKIGKVPSAHLRIDDDSVSRMHAVVEVTHLDVSLIDLGSTRGTFVNGKKINKATLQTGDVILLGDVRVELAIGDAAEAVRRPAALPAVRPPVLPAVRPPVLPAAVLPRTPAATPGAGVPAVTAPAAVALVATPPPLPVTRPAAPPAPSPLARSVALPLDMAAHPATPPRAIAEATDEPGGAAAVEVAAMLGDSVVSVKHCMDPRSGKVRSATWGLFAAGVACLVVAVAAFTASVRTEAANADRFAAWTRVEHKPAHAFRPDRLGAGVDWLTFGGLALGLVGVTLGLLRMRGERTSPYYRIGTAPGVELATEHAPLPAFPLVAPAGDDFVFNFAPGIDGELILDGKSTPLAELAAAGRSRPSASTAGAIEVPIPPRAKIRARAGQTTFVVSAVARPRRHAMPSWASFESRAMSYVAGSLAVHLGIWAFLQAIPAEAAGVSIQIGTIEDTGMVVKSGAPVEAPPEKRVDGEAGGKSGADAASMALPSGTAGKPDATKADGRMQVAQRQDKPQLSREEAIQLAISSGLLGSDRLMSGVRSMASTADFASGFDLANINGAIYGADGGGAGNFGGGVTGTDLGGGCGQPPCGTIGNGGRYNTIGTGPRPGTLFGLRDREGPGGHGHQQTLPRVGEPAIDKGSSYSKSIVRRYIRQHLNEIGYCYEKQLLAHPDLGGEVLVKFLISPTGVVQSASGTGFDHEVASCLSGVIGSIEFPKPGDGGSVQVTYPFNFHPTGH
jgi:FHA domain-containing protein